MLLMLPLLLPLWRPLLPPLLSCNSYGYPKKTYTIVLKSTRLDDLGKCMAALQKSFEKNTTLKTEAMKDYGACFACCCSLIWAYFAVVPVVTSKTVAAMRVGMYLTCILQALRVHQTRKHVSV
jgi:hypothetical protein